MKKIIKRLTAAGTWSAAADLTPIDLPREGFITEITVRANLTATLTATALDDVFRRCGFQNLKIEGDGGKAYLGMSGTQMSTMLGLWNSIAIGTPTVHSNGAGIALAGPDVGSTVFVCVYKFHPGSNPKDPFDTSVVIPAKFLSTLQAKLTTVAAAVSDGAGNITAGTFNYEVCEVLPEPVDKLPSVVMTPQGSTLGYAHTANYSDFSYDIDIPAGAFLRSIIMCVRDDTATVPRRKDDEVTGIAIKKPKTGERLIEQNIYEAKQVMMSRFACPGVCGDVGPIGAIATIRPAPTALLNLVPAGFVIVDLRPFGDPLYGLDMRGLQTGDYKLGLTIANYAAGDSTTIYWDQVIPQALN